MDNEIRADITTVDVGVDEEEIEELDRLSNLRKKEVVSRILGYLREEVFSQSPTKNNIQIKLSIDLTLEDNYVRGIKLSYDDLIARTTELISKKSAEELSDVVSQVNLSSRSYVAYADGIYLSDVELTFCLKTNIVEAIRTFIKNDFTLDFNLDENFAPKDFPSTLKMIGEIKSLLQNIGVSEYDVNPIFSQKSLQIKIKKLNTDEIERDNRLLLKIAKIIIVICAYLKINIDFNSQDCIDPNANSDESSESFRQKLPDKIIDIFLGNTNREIGVTLSPFIIALFVAIVHSLSVETADFVETFTDGSVYAFLTYLLTVAIKNLPESTE